MFALTLKSLRRLWFSVVVLPAISVGFAQTPAPKASAPAGGQITGPKEPAAEVQVAAGKAPAAKAATPPPPLPPPAQPKAIYLTWQRDPTTTMTVHWHTVWTEAFSDSVLEFRAANAGTWTRAAGRQQPLPFTDRMV